MAIRFVTPVQLIPDTDPNDPTAVVNVKFLDEHGGKRHAETITGDGTKTDWQITHALGTEDVVVGIHDVATKNLVFAAVTIDDADNVTVGFDPAPAAAAAYRVVVLG